MTAPAATFLSGASRERRIRLRKFCDQLAEVWYRPLFHAVSTRLWGVRKQLDRLDRPR